MKSLDEAVGRTDLLRLKEVRFTLIKFGNLPVKELLLQGAIFPKGAMDLTALLADPDPTRTLPRMSKSQASRADPDAVKANGLGAPSDGRDLDEVWEHPYHQAR